MATSRSRTSRSRAIWLLALPLAWPLVASCSSDGGSPAASAPDAAASADAANGAPSRDAADTPDAPSGPSRDAGDTPVDAAREADADATDSAVDAGPDSADSAPDTGPADAGPPVWQTVHAAGSHACARKTDGSLWCWGSNDAGQRGDGTNAAALTLGQVGAAGEWTDFDVGEEFRGNPDGHTCALKSDGTLWCWGMNFRGQLGDGTNTNRFSPTQVGAANDWVDVEAGSSMTCARKSDRSLWCWGMSHLGRLGIGPHGNMAYVQPVRVGTDLDWVAVSASGASVCAIKANGTLHCWGNNAACQLGQGGQCGTGVDETRNVPTQVGSATTWKKVAASHHHTCALQTDGSLWCWGENRWGAVGVGATPTMVRTPARVGADTDWADITAGYLATCAVKTNGTRWCWGLGTSALLGDGSTATLTVPTQVDTGTDWASVASGATHACGTRTTGALFCWGENAHGQVGDGTQVGPVLSPSPVP